MQSAVIVIGIGLKIGRVMPTAESKLIFEHNLNHHAFSGYVVELWPSRIMSSCSVSIENRFS